MQVAQRAHSRGRILAFMFRDGWPIKLSIASVVVVAMLVLAAAIIGLGWQGARQALLDTASRTASDAGQLITEKSRRMLEPAQATLRLLASDPLANARTLDERLTRLRTLSDVLVSNPLASAIYMGYDDGSFFLVRPLNSHAMRQRFGAPPKSSFLVQSLQMQANGQRVGEFLFFNANREFLARQAKPDYRFDPRVRPWYQNASGSSATLSSAPYVFFTTRQLGLTLSQSTVNGGGVIGIDVVLDDLAAKLQELRMTPNGQLALVDGQSQVLAYPDMRRVLMPNGETVGFKKVQDLGEPSLAALHALKSEIGKVVLFDVQGKEWLGVKLPFDVWQGEGTELLVAAPSDDLLGDLRDKRTRLAFFIALMVLLLLPLGWWAGSAIGRSLDRLTCQAARMVNFDFSAQSGVSSLVREVNNLSEALNDMGGTIETFLQVSQTMATEPRVDNMLEQVLDQLVSATRCTGGTVYLWDHKTGCMQRAALVGTVQGYESDTLAQTQSGTDHVVSGSGVGLLRQELRGRKGALEGLLVVQHVDDSRHAAVAFEDFVRKLSGMLAVAIETRQLIAAQKDLLDAVIKLMANAIDAKSPYTGGHCDRVPHIAGMLVDRMTQDSTGPYASFALSEEERYEFHLAAWLHDCGKVTSPEYIIDKATKLETIYNRIHEVRMRFEVLWRDAEIDCLQGQLAGGDGGALLAAKVQQQAQLQDDFAFVARCNVGGEFMADADLERLRALAGVRWTRYFDRRLGLSTEEARRLGNTVDTLPAQDLLLADRPDHVVDWGSRKPAVEKDDPRNLHGFDMVLPSHAQNMGELYNLGIRRGTLTDEDRFKINDHIVQTLIMLRSLPWPAHLSRVPDIAATHHEKLDGKGYPRKLPAEQLTIADRVMALADIFEALTAADRPYKSPKTLSESLRIMAFMAKDQHIDVELFRYFLHSGLWQTFADEFMHPEQHDAVDVAALEKLLPTAA
ncbi:MAG: HD domain-containing phosphohydrolase [Rhodoferax sp.]|nr:HD domain-containing phosphohydrolase [Rhodoferax sp.]